MTTMPAPDNPSSDYSVFADARAVLCAADPQEKCAAAQRLTENWDPAGPVGALCDTVPERPERPSTPVLVPPAEVPRRRLGTVEGRIALLHAVAHIEFSAIDLAADIICRFGADPAFDTAHQAAFITDWVGVCADEARHFGLIRARLQNLGADYGDHVAHDGLWEAALSTGHDIAARLALAPMVLEARGLDVTPAMIKKLVGAGDNDSAAILQIIYDDEVGHVAAGTRWFNFIAAHRNQPAQSYFQHLVRTHFSGLLKQPFNDEARAQAGLPPDFYTPLARKAP